MTNLIYLFTFALLFSSQAFAQNHDAQANREALRNAQQVLTDKTQRGKAINTNSNALQADKFANEITGGNPEEMYTLSAEILGVLYNDAAGDPEKMKAILEKASRDPAAFYNSLAPHMQRKVSEIAKKSPLNNVNKNPKP